MSENFIKNIALARAKKLFTKDFFETCTDSWYEDERDWFESCKVGKDQKNPSQKDIGIYMSNMQEQFNIYQDNYFHTENAVCSYGQIIDELRSIVNQIEEYKIKYKEFECPDDITLKLKQVGNYFVNVYNEMLPIYNNKVKNVK